jgi:hypothetical protein
MSSVTQNAARVMSERFPGAIVAGFDVHLRQITFGCLDSLTGRSPGGGSLRHRRALRSG